MTAKKRAKDLLLQLGLYYQVNLVRAMPDIASWLRRGCQGVAPHAIKMIVVMSYVRRFLVDEFIETGTYYGDTLDYVARSGIRCTSIELSDELYALAQKRFGGAGNVRLLKGDSAEKLPELLRGLSAPALFWLDGHYSGGPTASAGVSTPIIAELQAVLRHPVKRHVMLVDDARFFDGTHDYPTLEDVLDVVRESGDYSAEVSTDIIRIVPRGSVKVWT